MLLNACSNVLFQRKLLAIRRRILPQTVAPASTGASASHSRPGIRALLQIRKFQRKTDPMIKEEPFGRLVREIAQDFGKEIRFSPAALEALHEDTESYLISLFNDTNLCAIHTKRFTVTPIIEATASPSR